MLLQSLFSNFFHLKGCVWEFFLAQLFSLCTCSTLGPHQSWAATGTVFISHFKCWPQKRISGGKNKFRNQEKGFWSNSCFFRHLILKMPHGNSIKTLLFVNKTFMALNYLILSHSEQFCVSLCLKHSVTHKNLYSPLAVASCSRAYAPTTWRKPTGEGTPYHSKVNTLTLHWPWARENTLQLVDHEFEHWLGVDV